MKATYIVLACAAIGIATGTALGWVNFGGAPTALVPAPVAAPSAATGGQPKLIVDSHHYDFGPVEADHPVRHVFQFTNLGQATLTLKPGGTTCTKCTIAELPKTEVAPNETVGVTVEYIPTEAKISFRQTATILTNDPENPRVELSVYGTVTTSFRVLPNDLVLSKISTNDPHSAEVKLYAFLATGVRLESHEITEPETASYFEVTAEPLPPEQLTESRAKSACRIVLTVKPGLPLGPIRQTIRLHVATDDPNQRAKLDVPVDGTVVSDLSIVGAGWNGDQSTLRLGTIKSATGMKRQLFLLVRGEARKQVRVEAQSPQPAYLQVTLGEPTDLNPTVTQIPLTIEIPPGQPPGNYLDNDQGRAGEVILNVENHPQLKQLRMKIAYLIEP